MLTDSKRRRETVEFQPVGYRVTRVPAYSLVRITFNARSLPAFPNVS